MKSDSVKWVSCEMSRTGLTGDLMKSSCDRSTQVFTPVLRPLSADYKHTCTPNSIRVNGDVRQSSVRSCPARTAMGKIIAGKTARLISSHQKRGAHARHLTVLLTLVSMLFLMYSSTLSRLPARAARRKLALPSVYEHTQTHTYSTRLRQLLLASSSSSSSSASRF